MIPDRLRISTIRERSRLGPGASWQRNPRECRSNVRLLRSARFASGLESGLPDDEGLRPGGTPSNLGRQQRTRQGRGQVPTHTSQMPVGITVILVLDNSRACGFRWSPAVIITSERSALSVYRHVRCAHSSAVRLFDSHWAKRKFKQLRKVSAVDVLIHRGNRNPSLHPLYQFPNRQILNIIL